MKWRLHQLGWKYAVGELLIVTVGVLIALYIEQWNSERLAKAEEGELVERLLADLESDIESIERGESNLVRKISALATLKELSLNPQIEYESRSDLFREVQRSASWGWSQVVTRRATYNELIGSGKLGTISSADLRNQIAEYYDSDDSTRERLDERETEYPTLSYRLAPIDLNPRLVEKDEFLKYVQRIISDEVQELILAEENFAYFAQGRLMVSKEDNQALASNLEDHLSIVKN